MVGKSAQDERTIAGALWPLGIEYPSDLYEVARDSLRDHLWKHLNVYSASDVEMRQAAARFFEQAQSPAWLADPRLKYRWCVQADREVLQLAVVRAWLSQQANKLERHHKKY
jgi:hypothetical protein